MYPKLTINVYFIFLNIGDLTFGIALVLMLLDNISRFTDAQKNLDRSKICPCWKFFLISRIQTETYCKNTLISKLINCKEKQEFK
jgi:hypothetical protein